MKSKRTSKLPPANWKTRLHTFYNQHRLEVILLLLIITIGAYFRFFQIDQYLTFLGDEGRDARVVAKMITELDVVLIGPMTSVTTTSGHMYLGPAYYYLMMPFMLISNLSPVGPAVMVALFSLATIYLLWWVGRQWFHPSAGLIAAALYASSPLVIIYSRSSWNPNIMPFFSLLTVWSIYQVWQHKRYWWLAVTGLSIAVVLQSHYLGLMLIPVIGVFWVWIAWHQFRQFQTSKPKNQPSVLQQPFIKWTLIAVLIVAVMMSPLLIFDIRHDWLNFNAFKAFFTERQTTVNLKFYKGVEHLWPILKTIYTRLLSYQNQQLPLIVLAFTALGIVIQWGRNKFKSLAPALTLLLVWLVIGVAGLSSYKQHIYDHYFGFLFPVPFLFTGWLFAQLWTAKSPVSVFNCCFPLSKIWGILLVTGLILSNLSQSPLQDPPNRQMYHTREVAELVVQQSDSQPFNFGMIANANYDEGYLFFLERLNAPLVAIEPQNPQTITDQLFVICEDQLCNPVGHDKSEIANFGWSEIEQQWTFPWGHTLFKLKHFSPSETSVETE